MKDTLLDNKEEALYKPHLIALTCKCLVGALVKRGAKQRGRNFFYQIFEHLRGRIQQNPLLVMYDVILNMKPSVNLWNKRVGGTSYKLPYLISEEYAWKMAIRWFVAEANTRPERFIHERWGNLFIESYTRRSRQLTKKRDEIHRIALDNRAFLYKK